jgi:hypothetical protein
VKTNPTPPIFSPGFRLSVRDGVVLLVGCAVSLWLPEGFKPFRWVVLVAVGHFFLFCNVFRISRALELIWAAIFILATIGAEAFSFFGWPVISIAIGVTTVGVVACEMRKPSYHGICWKRINPRLREWWDARHPVE